MVSPCALAKHAAMVPRNETSVASRKSKCARYAITREKFLNVHHVLKNQLLCQDEQLLGMSWYYLSSGCYREIFLSIFKIPGIVSPVHVTNRQTTPQ